jgi:uncharacterized membrane protein (DUF485 family)
MKRKKKPGYYTLLALVILMVLGAVLTIMPISYAYKECMLGYKAHCTLTPVSTVSCLAVAAITWVVARTYFTEAR